MREKAKKEEVQTHALGRERRRIIQRHTYEREKE